MTASAAAGISALCFAVCMLLKFGFCSYLECMFFVSVYVLMLAGFHGKCGDGNKYAFQT